MRVLPAACLLFMLACASPVRAQETAAAPPDLGVGTTEWMATAGPAIGVEVFHSAEGHRYFLQALSWGRILSRPIGPGVLRGQFEWSFEVVPVYGQFDPENTYGFGFTPLHWRWNFLPRGRVAQFAELAGGALWTQDPVPARTTTSNFTAHIAYGLRYFVRPRLSVVGSYRFHHISNGNRLERNPGVNAHVLQLGLSLLKRR
jgi:lipid A 3-O-deacylase